MVVVVFPDIRAFAQSEMLFPLHAQGRDGMQGEAKNSSNAFFIYQNSTQVLPIVDDFSVDRTRHQDAQAGDPGVTLTETIYHLEVGGVSTMDQAFRSDTTFHIVVDTTQVDTIIVTTTPLPSSDVTVFDLSTYPVTSSLVTAWPPYTVVDTVGDVTSDTTYFSPDLVQDTLCVYTVDPDPATYTRADLSLVPLVLWEDDDVFINGTYPVDPPTIGVATFEGLNRRGVPYVINPPTSQGIADHLTTVPIDLQYAPADSIYLSFFFQPQGLSGDDQIQPQDSLILEFFAPDDDEWIRVWRSPYFALDAFRQVMIPITETRYLKPDFRFRFLNYATLSGALDHWHIDYVRLGEDRSVNDTLLTDVAFVMPEAGLLQTYTSVPFRKFEQAPASYMAPSVFLTQKNLSDQDRFIVYNTRAGLTGSATTAFGGSNNTSNNANSTFMSEHTVGTAGFEYDPALSTNDAFWQVKFVTNTTPDNNRYNDTAYFVQELSNYYAYDDGSAEAGYGLTNAPGGKLAYRFDMQGGDSLRAVRMYFDPIFYPDDPSNSSFLLTVWSGLAPEIIIHQNFSFSTPEYRDHGLNKFVEYALDSVIAVPSTFFIGWVQTGALNLNLGFDKNRNNQDKIFYNVSGSFLNTGFQGSLMMRPVMLSDSDPFTGIADRPSTHEGELSAYPVPVDELLWLHFEGMVPNAHIMILDAAGRLVAQHQYQEDSPIATRSMDEGMYFAQLRDAAGVAIAWTRFVVSH